MATRTTKHFCNLACNHILTIALAKMYQRLSYYVQLHITMYTISTVVYLHVAIMTALICNKFGTDAANFESRLKSI